MQNRAEKFDISIKDGSRSKRAPSIQIFKQYAFDLNTYSILNLVNNNKKSRTIVKGR